MIDEIDWQIMMILQKNARTPNAEIARQVGMAASAIFERLRKLEERGLIEEYTARFNPRAVGLGLLAFIFVRADEPVGSQDTAKILAQIPEVQEVHHIAGEDCYLVKVRTQDTQSLGRLLRESFGVIKAVRSTRTTIVLDTLKETAQLPLKECSEKGGKDDRAG
jgi:Lrp/AsnC family transcriptional regulator, leucine-responsive regulatory protein